MRFFALAAILLPLPWLAGCPTTRSGTGSGPVAVFGDPDPTAPIRAEAYPWPIDYALSGGRISVTFDDLDEDRSEGDVPMSQRLSEGLADRRGFSGTAAAMFQFNESLDVTTLPATPEAATQTRASVFITGVTGPDRARLIPIRVSFRSDENRLFLVPDYGQRLLAGETYAAVVTTQVRGATGPVRASDGFKKVLPPECESGWFTTSACTSELRTPLFAPLNAVLPLLSVEMREVAAATIFTIDRPEIELRALRDAVRAEAIAPLQRTRVFPDGNYTLDALFGVPDFTGLGLQDGKVRHDSVSHVVHGTFRAPLFIGESPGINGIMQFNADGTPVVRGHEDVPFLVVLPKQPADVTALPLVIYQHGLGGARSEALIVAEELCRRGYAVAAMDLPFHGSRTPPLPAKDSENNVTGQRSADGVGDNAGLIHALYSLGINSTTPQVAPLTPVLPRDGLRQGHADAFAFVHALLDGDKSALVEGIAEFAGLDFDDERVFWESESYGSIEGIPIVAVEPRIKAAVFSVGGGGLIVDLLMNSPTYGPPFGLFLYQALNLRASQNEDLTVRYTEFPPEKEWKLQVYQSIVDAADPMAFAPLLARRPLDGPARNMLFVAPFSDEAVPNQAQESVAMAAGALALGYPGPADLRFAKMTEATGDITANVGEVAVGFVQFKPADHGVLTRRKAQSDHEPTFPPFIQRADTLRWDNPVDVAQKTAADFFDASGRGEHTIRISAP